MQLRQSERKQAKIKMALQGSSGCGKSLSSLLLAKVDNSVRFVPVISV